MAGLKYDEGYLPRQVKRKSVLREELTVSIRDSSWKEKKFSH